MSSASRSDDGWTARTRRFVVAGSGPSLAGFDPRRISLDDTIVRVNNFFFESQHFLGRRVDLVQVGGDRWIFPFYAETLKKIIGAGEYEVAGWSCHQPHIVRRGKRTLKLPFVPLAYRNQTTRDEISELIGRSGKTPTTGVLAVLNAYGLGAETITLVGIDLYARTDRYSYQLSGHSAALAQQAGNGYNDRFHDRELDLLILRYLADRPDVEIFRAGEDGGALEFLPLAPAVYAPFERTPKSAVINDWVGWAGAWPIGAMRIARRVHELRRGVGRSLLHWVNR